MDETQKEKIKKMFSDWNELTDERKAINVDINKLLKKDETYINLIQEKKALIEKIKEQKEKISGELATQKSNINENMKLIVSDVKETLDLNSTIVNTIFRFYKKKFDHGIDDLDLIVTHYLEIFQMDEED